MSTPTPTQPRSNAGSRVAFVQATWHGEIVDQARLGFVETMPTEADLEFFELPGAYEIPLFVKKLAKTGRFDAIVAAGLVVDGGIYRHDFVADAVISGLMQVQLETEVPVFSVVLTPLQFHEHQTHEEFFTTHMLGKGREAARACLATLEANAGLSLSAAA